MIDDVTKNEIFSFVENVAEEFNIFNYEIKFTVVKAHFVYGGGGILASVAVSGTDYDGRQLHMDVSVKICDKTSVEDPVRKAFKRELFFYNCIVPYIMKFLKRHTLPDALTVVLPRCFKTFTTQDREVLIFNRLHDLGYKRIPPPLSADQNVIHAVLKGLAALHATSFSVQFEESREFLDTFKKWVPDVKDLFFLSNIEKKLNTGIQMAFDMLVEEKRDDIKNKLLKDTKRGTLSIIDNVLSNVPTECVVIHGDLWLHNVLILHEVDIFGDNVISVIVNNSTFAKMLDVVTEQEIFSYVGDVIQEEQFCKYKIKINVDSSSFVYGEGGMIILANVAGNDHCGRKLFLDLSIKVSKILTEKDQHIRMAYRREQLLFKYVFKLLEEFGYRKRLGIRSLLPYCHKILSSKEREVIIFNDINSLGYQALNTIAGLTTNTLQAILKKCAGFHALSFVVKSQHPTLFNETLSHWQPDTRFLYYQSNFEKKLKHGLRMVFDMLFEENRLDLSNKLMKDIKSGILYTIDRVLSNVPKESVIVHGGIWKNSIFVLNEKDNPTVAKEVKFIYWHLATLHSPALDLGYFFYMSYSEDIQINYESYVEYYYKEFTEVLVKLGTDPAKFSFLTLLDHLKNYSIMPLLVALGGIPLVILDEQLNIDVEEYEAMQYGSLQGDVKNLIKTKLLGVLELHYKYFGD